MPQSLLKSLLKSLLISVSLTMVVLALAWGCLKLIAFSPWTFYSPEQQREYLVELESHYRPLIEALSCYEEDHGWPADELSQLVPDYLDQLPELEPGHVEQFSYKALSFNSVHVRGSSHGRVIWFEIGEQEFGEHCKAPSLRPSVAGHRHLQFLVDEEGVVQGYKASPFRRLDTIASGARGSGSPLVDIMQEIEPLGRSPEVIREHFGTPTGDREFDFAWNLTVWLPEFALDIDADDFGYSSSEARDGRDPRGWSFSRN